MLRSGRRSFDTQTAAAPRTRGRLPGKLLVAVAVLTAAGLLLGLAGSGAAAQTAPSGASPTPAAGTEITRASDGQTVPVPQGGTVTVRLGEDLDWTLSFDPQGLLQPVPGVGTLARGVQAVLRAAQPGTTTLTAEGRPHCNPGQTCAQFIVSVIVTIVVEPASGGGSTQQSTPPTGVPATVTPPTGATASAGVVLPNTGVGGRAGQHRPVALAALGLALVLLLGAGFWLRGRVRPR